MKKLLFILGLSWVLAGCTEDTYQPISLDKDFIASVNIIEPSVQFFSADGKELAQWSFEKAYTGAVLVEADKIVLYGNQLSEIDYYQLSTGKKLKTIKTELGSTNGYYDQQSKQVFITNNKTNKVYSYDTEGEELGEVAVRNYPMSMIAFDGNLYVVNYKDTLLSVIDTTTLKVKAEWPIPSSSNGLWIDETNKQLWIGGHGEGAKANERILIYKLADGTVINELPLPVMPIAISSNGREQAVVSHGNSMVYIIKNQQIQEQIKVAANPFAISNFENQWIVAGYDDANLYFLENGEIVQKVATGKGPFQLIKREVAQ